jgi:hypothetical protein
MCSLYVILRVNSDHFQRIYTYSGDALIYQTSAQFSCVLRTDYFPTLHLLRSALPQHKFHGNIKRTLSGNSHTDKIVFHLTSVVSLTNLRSCLYSKTFISIYSSISISLP